MHACIASGNQALIRLWDMEVLSIVVVNAAHESGNISILRESADRPPSPHHLRHRQHRAQLNHLPLPLKMEEQSARRAHKISVFLADLPSNFRCSKDVYVARSSRLRHRGLQIHLLDFSPHLHLLAVRGTRAPLYIERDAEACHVRCGRRRDENRR